MPHARACHRPCNSSTVAPSLGRPLVKCVLLLGQSLHLGNKFGDMWRRLESTLALLLGGQPLISNNSGDVSLHGPACGSRARGCSRSRLVAVKLLIGRAASAHQVVGGIDDDTVGVDCRSVSAGGVMELA